jgi:hypothetical protein
MTPWAFEFYLNCPDRSWCVAPIWANTRESGDTDQARTNLPGASQGTMERKEKREDAFNKKNWGPNQGKETRSRHHQSLHRLRARLRSTPLRSAWPAVIAERNNLKT